MLNQPLPTHVDPFKMADSGAVLEGELATSDFPRLSEGLLSSVGNLHVRLEFNLGEEGFRELVGSVSGKVSLQCQRCMEPMDYDLDVQIHLAFAFHEEMAKSFPKHLDAVVCTPDENIEVIELIQDDLILNIPQFSMHPAGDCEIQTIFADPDDKHVQDEEKSNPFSILAQIKSPGNEN